MRHLVVIPTLAAMSGFASVWTAESPTLLPTTLDADVQDSLTISATRLKVGIAGASNSIIDAETIADSPAQSLPELLSYQAGIQYRDLFGEHGGSQASVDMRGFGAANKGNTLILFNGRRLNDVDLSAIDLANIPMETIARIEVIRGNAGAVLYGDGAVGGVINIISKDGASPEPSGVISLTAGSDDFLKGSVSYMQDIQRVSVLAFASTLNGDGYRDNNEIEQDNFFADIRYSADRYDIYSTLTFDDQSQGLPGGRLYEPGVIDELGDDRRGTASPDDNTDKTGYSATLGLRYDISDSLEGVFDFGYSSKEQESEFFDAFGNSFVDTTLNTFSITPRLAYSGEIAGMPWNSINGIDMYVADYDSARRAADGGPKIHDIDAEQTTIALYTQNTFKPQDKTEVSFGLRLQQYDFSGQDDFDAGVVFFPDPGGKLADTDVDDIEYAAHLGADYAFTDEHAVFVRIGRSFRLPTIDERAASNALELPGFTFPADASFDLEVQTSIDFEIGYRSQRGTFQWQVSAYWMQLENELHFDVESFVNVNLDDTERDGIEIQGTWDISTEWTLFASGTLTNAEFTSGSFEGNDVPLVAPYSISTYAQWKPLSWLSAMLVVNHVAEQWMDNDQGNTQPEIPDYTLVDIKVRAQYQQWEGSLAVNNLFNEEYFNYAVASAFTPDRYSAYPLPGTTFTASLAYHY